MRGRLYAVVAAGLVLCAVSACEKVPRPSSDSTRPILTWRVENRTAETSQDLPRVAQVYAKHGDVFRVTLIAHDPEGIQKITTVGGYERRCAPGQHQQHAYPAKEQSLSPDSEGKVLTKIFLIASYDPDVTCSGWRRTTLNLLGTGTNYFNGTTYADLTINVTPTGAPPDPPSKSYGDPAKVEREVLVLVNDERAKAGCGKLQSDPRLAWAARRQSQDMIARNFFDHTNPDGVGPSARARSHGFTAGVGENIAGAPYPRDAVNNWMTSEGHRANILNCRYRLTGVGVAPGGPFGNYWTQEFS